MLPDILCSLIIAGICGISLLIFMHYNRYKRVERFYYYHDKYLYILLELVYYLLFISFVFNARFLVFETIKTLLRQRFNIDI